MRHCQIKKYLNVIVTEAQSVNLMQLQTCPSIQIFVFPTHYTSYMLQVSSDSSDEQKLNHGQMCV